MAQKWDDSSYFIERKPQSIQASVFLNNPGGLKMYKVPIHDEVPYVQKNFRRLANEVPTTSLNEYLEDIANKELHLRCTQCELGIFSKNANDWKITTLPADDWLETSPSMEYFCYSTCGDACAPSDLGHSHEGKDGRHHVRQSEGLLGITNMAEAINKWLPSNNHFVLADSFILLTKNDHLEKVLINEHGAFNTLKCARCLSDLGYSLRKHKHVYKLFLTATDLFTSDPKISYIPTRYGEAERYFSWLLLQRSEIESSLKLVIRSTEKKPHMLVWVLESYYIMTLGQLKETTPLKEELKEVEQENELKIEIDVEQEIFQAPSFQSLKILYKVFDEESALSDPRATGGDASIGFIDLPTNSVMKFMEILMTNSLFLPPMCRAVGQFYVGFLRISEKSD